MNQYPSHSQTPDFVKNESHTNPVLFQHPPSSEQLAKSNKRAQVKAVLKEVAAISLIGITVVSTVFTVRSCSNDVDRQHAQAIKHQLQFSASNEGAR